MVEIPETRYARNGPVSIAYQVVGDGPIDVVFMAPAISHLELGWEYPPFAHVLVGVRKVTIRAIGSRG